MAYKPKELSSQQQEALLALLQDRFEGNMRRHPGLAWHTVAGRLQNNKSKLYPLQEMERTGGAPDVVAYDEKTGEVLFCDCATQSPAGRRSLCYDRQALDSRKTAKPQNSAVDMAAEMGVQLLTEAQYRGLQKLGAFDTTTSSWVQTPAEIRMLGGALFCDRRYNHVFLYHNGAESYYSARGFRACLTV